MNHLRMALICLGTLGLFLLQSQSVRAQFTLYFWYPSDLSHPKHPANAFGTDDVFLLGSAVFPGDFYDLLYHNGYLWLADGLQYYSGNLKVFDVSDPENPTVVATESFPEASAFRLEGDGDRVYLSAKERGVLIYDATNPLNPQLLGEFATTDAINDMDVLGDLLCILGENNGLSILDVSDPQSISELSQTATAGHRYSLAVGDDSLLMIAAGSSGLLFYHVGDPEAPRYLNTLSLTQKGFHDVVRRDTLAYAIYRSTIMNTGGFAVIDLSDPPNFSILSQNTTFGVEKFPECGLAIEGDTLFFAATQGGMGVWDVSDPEAPSRWGGFGGAWLPGTLAQWSTRVSSGGGYAYTISPDRLIIPTHNEACVVDLTNLTDPHPIGTFDPPDFVIKAVGSGNYAYVAASTDGLIAVDISTSSSPAIVGNMEVFDIYFSAGNLIYEDGLVYINGGANALEVISVTDPSDPQLIGQYDDNTPTYTGLDKWDNIIAVTGFGVAPAPPGWMWIVDVSNPANPLPMGFINLGVSTRSVTLVDTLAYIAFANGLGVVDISNPYNPTLISQMPTGEGAFDVVVAGDVAFVGDQSSGLVILDVSDPYHLGHISTLQTPGIPVDLELVGDSLYIADSTALLVVDVYDLNNPVITDIAPVNGFAQGVSCDEGRIFLCDGYGFHIYSHEILGLTEEGVTSFLPRGIALVNYPNPFNPTTVLSFELRDASFVKLEVFDIAGRSRGLPLKGGWMEAGYHKVTFDGSGLASGLYFCRIQAGDFSAVRKMMLVK